MQKAVSRLDFAPNLKEIQITDIKKGLGVFTPKRDKPVSFALLQTSLKKAGYKLDTAEINVSGTLQRDDKGWWIVADPSGQRFALEGATLGKVLADAVPDTRVSVTKALKATTGVEDVQVSFDKGEAVVKYDDQKVTEAKIREVINSTGFKTVEKKAARRITAVLKHIEARL